MFSALGNNAQQLALSSIDPQARYRKALADVKAIEQEMVTAEDRLIKARRWLKVCEKEFDSFHGINQNK